MMETTFNYRYITNDADFIVINKSALMRAYHIKAFQELSRSEHEQCYTVDFMLNAIILPFIGIIGIVGNISGILCFSKQLNLTYYALMFSLAISDLLTIVSFVCYYSLPLWLNHYTIIENQTIAIILFGSYITWHVSQLIDIYLLISLSIERYYSICRPMAYRKHKISLFKYLTPIIILSCAYCVPLYFESRIKHIDLQKYQNDNETSKFVGNATVYLIKHTNLKIYNQYYKLFYENVSKLVIKCVVPYIVLISTNVLIVRTLCRFDYTIKKRKPRTIDFENSEERKKSSQLRLHTNARGVYLRESQIDLGIINLAITIVFLICYSLIWIWVIYDLRSLLGSSISKVRRTPILWISICKIYKLNLEKESDDI